MRRNRKTETCPLTRKPVSTLRDRYHQQLFLPVLTANSPPALPPDALRALLALTLGMKERPILWQAPLALAAVLQLWRILWPQARSRFSFCTFALQARMIEQRPFDFLALPDSARGSFHDVRSLPTWFVHGRLDHPQAQSLLDEAWLKTCIAAPEAFIAARLAFCSDQHLHPPLPSDLPLLLRCEQLLHDAGERLSAARSLADLLDARFSALPWHHPLRRAASEHLLHGQPKASLEPRPLWELTDFLSRSWVQARAAAEPNYAEQIESLLATELARRLRLAPEATRDALPTLRRTLAKQPSWIATLDHCVEQWLASLPEAESLRFADSVCQMATEHDSVDLAAAALRSLSPAQRRQLTGPEHQRAPWTSGAWLARLGTVLGDPWLTYQGRARMGQPGEALAELRLLARESEQDMRALQDTLRQAPLELRLSFGLEEEQHAVLSAFAQEEAVQAAAQLELSLDEVAARAVAANSDQAARVFLAAAARTYNSTLRKETLVGQPQLALRCVLLTLSGTSQTLSYEAEDALNVLQPEQLLLPSLRSALAGAPKLLRTRVMERVTPALVSALCQSRIAPEESSQWLQAQVVSEHWDRATVHRSDLFAAFPGHEPGPQALAPLAQALAHAFQPPTPGPAWLSKVLRRPLEATSADTFSRALPALAHLLDRPLTPDVRRELCALCLERVRTMMPAQGYVLIERSFPVAYPDLAGNYPGMVRQLLSWALDYDDRQKAWRHFLLDRYREQGWPLGSLLRAIGGDDKLLRKLCGRARKLDYEQGRRFVQQLAAAAAEDPELPKQLRDEIQVQLDR